MNFQNVSPRASDPLFKEATELWHNLRSLSEWSIPLRMMGNQLLCTCSAPWLPLEGSSLVMTLGCEWSDHSECEHDHSVQLCTHITLFKWLLLSTTNLTRVGVMLCIVKYAHDQLILSTDHVHFYFWVLYHFQKYPKVVSGAMAVILEDQQGLLSGLK